MLSASTGCPHGSRLHSDEKGIGDSCCWVAPDCPEFLVDGDCWTVSKKRKQLIKKKKKQKSMEMSPAMAAQSTLKSCPKYAPLLSREHVSRVPETKQAKRRGRPGKRRTRRGLLSSSKCRWKGQRAAYMMVQPPCWGGWGLAMTVQPPCWEG
ncbi:hypothetical protein VUR80DRAFT_4555 [Thermomyces stellatus]